MRSKEVEQEKAYKSYISKDHIGFFIFLMLLLLAPEIQVKKLLPQMGLERSTLSLGAVGLLIWLLISPGYVTRVNLGVIWSDSLLLVKFGFYALFVSIMFKNFLSIAYAFQYVLYLVLGYLLLSAYFKDVLSKDELTISFNVIATIFTIYGIGVLISVFIGPIYPFQTSTFARTWGGISFNQAVGFSDNPNGAGAMLIVINSFFWFLYRHKGRFPFILSLISFFSLLLTFSRGAIFSFLFAVGILYLLLIVKIFMRPNLAKEELVIVVGVSAIFVSVLFFILMVLAVPRMSYFRSILLGFGITGSEIIETNLVTRLELWRTGILTYLNSDFIRQIVGNGFRATDYIDSVGNWITPHNFYINALGDFGILGTILFLLSFFIALTRSFTCILKLDGIEIFEFSFVAIVGLLVMNMTEVFFYSPTLISMILLIFILQSTIILSRKKSKTKFKDLDR